MIEDPSAFEETRAEPIPASERVRNNDHNVPPFFNIAEYCQETRNFEINVLKNLW
jgi:hypothetical protein